MLTERPLNVTSTADAKSKVSDVEVVGNPDLWTLMVKASSKSGGWMKSTKGMAVPGGVLVQVSSQQKNEDGTWALAEAVAYVPNALIVSDVNGGFKIDARY